MKLIPALPANYIIVKRAGKVNFSYSFNKRSSDVSSGQVLYPLKLRNLKEQTQHKVPCKFWRKYVLVTFLFYF